MSRTPRATSLTATGSIADLRILIEDFDLAGLDELLHSRMVRGVRSDLPGFPGAEMQDFASRQCDAERLTSLVGDGFHLPNDRSGRVEGQDGRSRLTESPHYI